MSNIAALKEGRTKQKLSRLKRMFDEGQALTKAEYEKTCGKEKYTLTKRLLRDNYPIVRMVRNGETYFYKLGDICKIGR